MMIMMVMVVVVVTVVGYLSITHAPAPHLLKLSELKLH